MYVIRMTIRGFVPLLMCKFPMPKHAGGHTKKHKGKNSEEDVQQSLEDKAFKDEKGMYMRADNLRMILIGNKFRKGAGYFLGHVIESGKAAIYTSMCNAFVWVRGPVDPMKVYFEPARKTWDDVDRRSCVLAGTKGRGVIERPMICTPWLLTFEVQVLDDSIQPSLIENLYRVGGLWCGLGVYGPTFGRYEIEKFEVVEEKKKKNTM